MVNSNPVFKIFPVFIIGDSEYPADEGIDTPNSKLSVVL